MNDKQHINKVARRYLFEMARMIQFGGETLFVHLDGGCTEHPDQGLRGLPELVTIDMDEGKVGSFHLHTVRVRGIDVHLYLEVAQGINGKQVH